MRFIDFQADIASGLTEGGSTLDADAALAAAMASGTSTNDDLRDESVKERLADAESFDKGSIAAALLGDGGALSTDVGAGLTSADDEDRHGNTAADRARIMAEYEASLPEIDALTAGLPDVGNDGVSDALMAKLHLDIAAFGFHTNVLTDDTIFEDDWLARGEHWGALSNEQRGQAVSDGVVDLIDAQELDQLAVQAREVVAEVNQEAHDSATLDAQVSVLAKVADELHLDAEAFTEDVLREIAERDGVNPATLSPQDLDTAIRMTVERDRREKLANASAQFKHELVGSTNSVREGLEQAGEPVDDPYAALISTEQFEYGSLVAAISARDLSSPRAIRAGVAQRTVIDKGSQDFSALASKIAAKAAKSRGL